MPSRRFPAVLTVVTLTLTLGLSGCGGDDSTAKPTPKPTRVTVTGPGSTPSVNFATGKQFVQALAQNTPASLSTAASLSTPKSAASRYVAKAADDLGAGAGAGAAPLKLIDQGEGRYRLCPGAGACTVIAQLVLLDGKVTTFKVNGKQLR